MQPHRFLIAALLCLFPVGLAAQQYTAKRIRFVNPGPYAESELLTIAAIHPGDTFNKDQLRDATVRLTETGYFDGVEGTVDGLIKAVDLIFTLKPTDQTKLVAVGYENFVWFAPGELAATLNKTVPLLSHGLSQAGDWDVGVQTAIEQLLAGKSVAAKVTHALVPPSTRHPNPVYEYRVEAPAVVLHNAQLSGVAPAMEPAVKIMLARAIGTAYNEGLAGVSTVDRLLDPWFNEGYLDVKLTDVQRTIVAGAAGPRVQVDLTATVDAGQTYRVSALAFAGTPVVSAETFEKLARLHPGDIASRQSLSTTFGPMTRAYRDQGYMDAVVDATAVLDPAVHQVAYTVTIDPGQQYHVKSIVVKGLPPAQQADFIAAFGLHPGDVYNEGYVGPFLFNNKIASLRGYAGNFTASADPDTLLVDLTVSFSPSVR